MAEIPLRFEWELNYYLHAAAARTDFDYDF